MFERATPGRVRVSVNSTAIQSLYEPGGDVWQYARNMGIDMEAEAIRRAPSRAGELKTKHGSTTTPIGRFGVRATVHNDASYAVYVHEGTLDKAIVGNMTVRPMPHSWYRESDNRHRTQVRGQRAQPWMSDAMLAVVRRRGL